MMVIRDAMHLRRCRGVVRRWVWTVAVILGLVLTAPLVTTQVRDLDLLDDDELEEDLLAELDDIYEDFDEDEEYPLGELREAMLDALGDDGDDGDELVITFAALQQEMTEAGTTIVRVLDTALAAADAVATRPAPPTWRITPVAGSPTSVAQRRGNGRTTPRQAVRQGVSALARATNAR